MKLSLKDLPVTGKKVLMRVDFNVPLDKNQAITDDSRIRAALPSIQYVLNNGGALILMSHLGRPKGKTTELSLAPCAARLSQLLHKPVVMAPDCIGEEVENLAQNLKPGQILLLENLRFHEAEEKPDKDKTFAKSLAKLGDVYVNDAFGTAHRAHSSTAAITQYFPDSSAAGFLLQKEIDFLSQLVSEPKRPFVAMIGGAKVSSKIGVIKALLEKVDALLIGGGMAFTFFKAQGIPIGKSIHEDDFLQEAKKIIEAAKSKKIPLLLPVDVIVASEPTHDATAQVIPVSQGIPDNLQGLDVGPQTVALFTQQLQPALTVLWNGPLGVFEVPAFAKGTLAIAEVVAALKATTIVGGGDSVAAIEMAGVADKISHLSTGGGASLEFLELGTLPGIEALSEG